MAETSPPPDSEARRAVAQNLQALLGFLQNHPPFDAMEQTHLLYLLEHSRLVYFAAGQTLLTPDDGKVRHWYVVRQGHVLGQRQDVAGTPDTPVDMLPGDGFPLAAIIGERPTRRRYSASEDTFCLQVPVEQFARLMEVSEVFRHFALRGVSALLGRVGVQMQASAAQSLSETESLNTPLGELLGRAPITCLPQTSVRAAVQRMHEHRTGSIAVVDEADTLRGIFTLRDLRGVVIDSNVDLDGPIALVMTPSPKHLAPSDTAFDATMLMAQHHFGHICIVEDGRLRGVVSERDLFALQRVDLVQLARAIRGAASVDDLALIRGSISRLVASMLAHGASAEQVLRIVTQLNDHSVTRVIELMRSEHGDPGIPFGWIAFGSEARGEQTLFTDQDNGLIFEAANAAEAAQHQARLLPLAHAINTALDRIGLSWCTGNIMASNPELCQANFQWRAFFSRMFHSGDPQSLLRSTIFFDMRLVWGEDAGFSQVRQHAVGLIQQESAFQRLMAAQALERTPPLAGALGGLKGRLVHAFGGSEDRIDLKKHALVLFVDAARLLALAHGLTAASTVQRLQQLAAQGHLSEERVTTYITAFNYLQQLRLAHQQRQLQADQPLDNVVVPSEFNALDQRVLRGALLEAGRLQDSLRLRYRL